MYFFCVQNSIGDFAKPRILNKLNNIKIWLQNTLFRIFLKYILKILRLNNVINFIKLHTTGMTCITYMFDVFTNIS